MSTQRETEKFGIFSSYFVFMPRKEGCLLNTNCQNIYTHASLLKVMHDMQYFPDSYRGEGSNIISKIVLLSSREWIFKFTWELLLLSGGSKEPPTPSVAVLAAPNLKWFLVLQQKQAVVFFSTTVWSGWGGGYRGGWRLPAPSREPKRPLGRLPAWQQHSHEDHAAAFWTIPLEGESPFSLVGCDPWEPLLYDIPFLENK